jgi:hypothetical protein
VSAPVAVKLRCRTWRQLGAIYRRDLSAGVLFLKSQRPPPLGTQLIVELVLPSGSLVPLSGGVSEHVPPDGQGGRGPGLVLALATIPSETMWLLESALQASGDLHELPGSLPGGEPGAAAEDAPLDDAERELVAALTEELESMRKLNPFQVLNVGYGADDEAIRRAFGELARRYHPDRFARYPTPAARERGSEIFLIIRNAYKQLGDQAARSKALRALGRDDKGRPLPSGARPPRATPVSVPIVRTPSGATPPPTPTPAASGPAAAVGSPPARRATLAPVEEDFGDLFTSPPATAHGAPVEVEKAVERPPISAAPAPPMPPGVSAHDNASQAIERGDYERAAMVYSMILRKAPNDIPARAGIELANGLRALAQRDRLEAAERFEAVLALEPTNERAARELADMRRKNTSERTGLLSRLRGKEPT